MKTLENVFQRTNETVFDVDSGTVYPIGSAILGGWIINVYDNVLWLKSERNDNLDISTQSDVNVLYNAMILNDCDAIVLDGALNIQANKVLDFRGIHIESRTLILMGSKEIKNAEFKIFKHAWYYNEPNVRLKVKNVKLFSIEGISKLFIKKGFYLPPFDYLEIHQIVITAYNLDWDESKIVKTVLKGVKHHSKLSIYEIGAFKDEIKVSAS